MTCLCSSSDSPIVKPVGQTLLGSSWDGEASSRLSALWPSGLHGWFGITALLFAWGQIISGSLRRSRGGPPPGWQSQLDSFDASIMPAGDHYDMTPRRHRFEAWYKLWLPGLVQRGSGGPNRTLASAGTCLGVRCARTRLCDSRVIVRLFCSAETLATDLPGDLGPRPPAPGQQTVAFRMAVVIHATRFKPARIPRSTGNVHRCRS